MFEPETHTDVPSFNLLVDPWIRCLDADGVVRERGLNAVFSDVRDIREIVGEIPTQTFAITRLLLAILYRALDGEGEDPGEWGNLWREGLPVSGVQQYLSEYHDRFNLFDPVYPFFQVADLHTSKNEFKGVVQLILDLPANNTLFTTRGGESATRLSFAEAARWLVNAQSFDFSGIKSGAVNDPRVKGGKGYPQGVAWAGLIGGVLVEGDSLHETLLLNLAPHRASIDDDLPVWEVEVPDGPAPSARGARGPRGPAALYTWQNRRIRLFEREGVVVGSLLCYGDPLTPQNMQGVEPMSAWRRSAAQEKKLRSAPVYMPREHHQSRAFWRGLSAVLPRTVEQSAQAEAPAALPPYSLEWIAQLLQEGVLERSVTVRLRAIGVVYGTQSSVVSEVIDDRLMLPLSVVGENGRELAAVAEAAVTRAENAVRALERLDADLTVAAGGEHRVPADSLRELGSTATAAYLVIDPLYRRWLGALRPGLAPGRAYDVWKEEVHRQILILGAERLALASPQAWAGRLVDGRRLNSAIAESRFRRALQSELAPTAEILEGKSNDKI
ncbi:type I-E CRISPR-associated protein Cse1/CasA [Mycetocola tolaasinivorans]|uniref:Type I-E CRISPR-associated protein Cse1/CasA n=1 Tax=Mycetocola tolaasinivorans TaxID=76635 RepID=A0A3L7A420_9MICO|nr:type I-E CRISPR-associated protein Cse1/CasA [Mycetocola tolaasinivorans]RLP74947.1 type I-E CRISPR-associated protein Cse1/CasA [Mycetocola tolaasinivorans]